MKNAALSFPLVLAIIFAVPFVIYAAASAVTGMETPGGSPLVFLTSVLVSKIGTALALVLLFYFARGSFSGRWVLYAAIWWLMFVIGEVGQAIGPDYSWQEAIAGVVSETIYFPLSAYLLNWMIRP
jgi:hypothetical protein